MNPIPEQVKNSDFHPFSATNHWENISNADSKRGTEKDCISNSISLLGESYQPFLTKDVYEIVEFASGKPLKCTKQNEELYEKIQF